MDRNVSYKKSSSAGEWLKYHLVTKKMNSPFGIAALVFVTLVMSYITVLVDYKMGVGIVVFAGIVLMCIAGVLYPFFGFYFTFFISIFLVLPERILNTSQVLPMGLIPEYFSYLVLLGVITKQHYRKEIDGSFWANAITVWLIVLMGYYTLQLFNPSMDSKLGWFNFFRKQVSYAAFFYISYSFLNSRRSINTFTTFWIALCTFEALYACSQQWFGFMDFEWQWLISEPLRYELFVNWGFARKFGLLSDPAAAGILYSSATLFVIVLGLQTKNMKKQAGYFLLAIIYFLASSYTGTRTGTLMIVAGVAFYAVMTLYQKRTIIFAALFAMLMVFIMVVPIYDSVVINRIRSTFEGSKDPSAYVRDLNRKSVQPYIYRHPIGGGAKTAGQEGEMYNPGHVLAGIPPDSGYMKILMELGPIGLALNLIFYFVILRKGIYYFYRVNHTHLKSLYAAYLVSVFSLMVAQFSQIAIGQYPSILFLYTSLAIFLKLHKYDYSISARESELYSHA